MLDFNMKEFYLKKVTLNPDYFLRHDKKRSYIMNWHQMFGPRYNGESNFSGFIHPVHAMILTFFNGQTIRESIDRASGVLGIQKYLIEKFIEELPK